jgi:hypothetical protein
MADYSAEKCMVLSKTCLVVFLAALLVNTANATEIVSGNIQGWKNSYQEPSSDDSVCSKNESAAVKCAIAAQKHSGSFLAELREKIAVKLSAKQQPLFRKAEKQWDVFRNSSCDFEAADVAQAVSLTQNSCINAYNLSRIELLSKFHYCLSGGKCSSDFSLFLIAAWQRQSS